MKPDLTPMFDFTEKCITHRGRYDVQLEIPYGSSVTDNDIGRILQISSWEDDDMQKMADAYEGARGVKIRKDKPSYTEGIELPALYIAGVGHIKINRSGKNLSVFSYGKKMLPPETSNFFDSVDFQGLEGGTSEVVDGRVVFKRPDYAPLGSYLESKAKEKIVKTREAGNMMLETVAVPKVEAYGRYIDLEKDGEHLSFIVFTVPSLGLRFGQKIMSTFSSSYQDFTNYMNKFAGFLGEGVREVHDHSKCHRQLHFDNMYYNSRWPGRCKLYVMDWVTSQMLGGFEDMNRALDIKIPWQNFKTIQKHIFSGGKGKRGRSQDLEMTFWTNSMLFTGEMLSSYYNRDIDIMQMYNDLRLHGINEELAFTMEVMRRTLY